MLSKFSFFIILYLAISIFFPAIIYIPVNYVAGFLVFYFDAHVSNGFKSISYFGALPLVGVVLYLVLNKTSKDNLYFIANGNYRAEYLGCFLVGVWYFSTLYGIYTEGSSRGSQVVIPTLSAPITSLGLYFSGLVIGFIFSLILHKLFCSRRIK